jgi:hypothetical protein
VFAVIDYRLGPDPEDPPEGTEINDDGEPITY